MKHRYFERLREQEPANYTWFRQVMAEGAPSQFFLLNQVGIGRQHTAEAAQFLGSFIDGLTYIARRFDTTVGKIEFTPEPGINYNGWTHSIRVGSDVMRMGMHGIQNPDIRYTSFKASEGPVTAQALAFAFGVEEAYHAHQARTDMPALKASLALQREKGITPNHPEYHTALPHERAALFIVREAMQDAGYSRMR